MAHYAKVIDNKVVQIIVAEKEFFDTFLDDTPGLWLQCSYNTIGGKHYNPDGMELSNTQDKALRKNFPGVGFWYDEGDDAFYSPSPYASWILNRETYLWEPPVEMPVDDNKYSWNEENQTWDLVDGN